MRKTNNLAQVEFYENVFESIADSFAGRMLTFD